MARPARAVREPYDHDQVVRAAVAVFKDRGYDGTSMADIAARLGISKGSLYHHIDGKEQLLDEAASGALDRLFAMLDEPGSAAGPAVGRLEHVIRRTVQITVERLDEVSVMLRVRPSTAAGRRALDRRREFDGRVEAIVAAAAEEGALRDDVDPALVTRLVFGMSNSVTGWYRPGRGLDARRLADSVVALCFEGLRG